MWCFALARDFEEKLAGELFVDEEDNVVGRRDGGWEQGGRARCFASFDQACDSACQGDVWAPSQLCRHPGAGLNQSLNQLVLLTPTLRALTGGQGQ